jgi:4-oxalocrotonate tautomerase family enzyme
MAERFDKFTESARRTLTYAQEEAQRLRHNYIDSEHLLLGLLRTKNSVGCRVLTVLSAQPDKIRAAIEVLLDRTDSRTVGQIGLMPQAKRVIELAVGEARSLEHGYVGTEHLLLGLVLEGEGIAASVLESLGVSVERARAEVVRLLGGAGASEPRRPPGGLRLAREPVVIAKQAAAQTKGVVEMPIIRVEMWPGRTHAQKQELARVLTEAMCNIANTTPEATIVVFHEVAREDWAQGGRLASEEDD